MKYFGKLLMLGGWFVIGTPVAANPVLLARSQKIAGQYGNHVWPGFAQTKFPTLIVDQELDRYYCPPNPPSGFEAKGVELTSGCLLFTRPAKEFPVQIQATFPFLDNTPVIIIGAPGLSENNPAAWIATVLHEHFHQYQMSRPGYFDGLAALDLEDPDAKKMWMLHFDFAYENTQTINALSLLSTQLANILAEPEPDQAHQQALVYARLRPLVLGALSARDRRYLEFQLWQEGVARYTELVMIEYAAAGQSRLPGQPHDFSALAANLRKTISGNLQTASLAKHKRVYFYSLGAAEALVLDILGEPWKERYFSQPFSLADHFDRAGQAEH